MSFLSLNGIVIPIITAKQPQPKRDIIGKGIDRANDGSAHNNFNAKKWRYSATTQLMAQADAIFIANVLEALGDHWSFESGDLLSDKAQALAVSGAAFSTVQPKYGVGCLLIHGSSSDTATATLPSVAFGWTLMCWRYDSGTTYNHYIVTSVVGGTVQRYQNGTLLGTGLPNWLTVNTSTNTITIQHASADGATNIYYDEIVTVPAYCPLDLVSGLYTFHNTQAWPSPYPTMQASGDFMPATINVMAQPGQFDVIQAAISGSFVDNNMDFAFDLIEA